MIELDFSPYAKVEWLEDLLAVRVKWQKLHMSMEKFKEICDEVFIFLIEKKSKIWIADKYESYGVFNPDVQKYIDVELTELGVANGVEKVLTIMPKHMGLASLATKSWNKEMYAGDNFIMENFSTLEECKVWLSEFKIAN